MTTTRALFRAACCIALAICMSPIATTSASAGATTTAHSGFPSTFAGVLNNRLAVFRSKDGTLVRYLTPAASTGGIGFPSLSPGRKTVFYVATTSANPCPSTYAAPLAGGRRTLAFTGQEGESQPIAVGPRGAFAGLYACIATQGIRAHAANGHSYSIFGSDRYGVDGMSWAPDGLHLAVGTPRDGVRYFDVRTPHGGNGLPFDPVPPCPASMRGCVTHAPAYSPLGTLYYVAVNKAGTKAEVVRKDGRTAKAVFTLPRVCAHYSLAVARGGQVLVSGDPDSSSMTQSQFVVRWDGTHRHTLKHTMLQVDW